MQIVKITLTVLTLLLLLAAGAYFFMQRGGDALSLETNPVSVELLSRTQVYISRQAELRSITLDTRIFEDPRFSLLQSFETPVPEQNVGKNNLFSPYDTRAAVPRVEVNEDNQE